MYRDKRMTGVQSKWRRKHLQRAYLLGGVFRALSSSVVEDDRHTKARAS